MWCYYNHADEVELFVNGKSQGVRSKTPDCKVVARKGGEVVGEQEIRTAGEPAQIRLTPDRAQLDADGKDLSFVTVEIVDKDGTLCPNADNLVNFQVEGNAFIAGVDNGSPISGKCLVVLQNTGKPGEAKLTVTSEGLSQAEISVVAE